MPRSPVYLALVIAIVAAIWLGQGDKAQDTPVDDVPATEAVEPERGPLLQASPQTGPLTLGAAPQKPGKPSVEATVEGPLEGASPWIRARVRITVQTPEGERYARHEPRAYAISAEAPEHLGHDDEFVIVKYMHDTKEPVQLDLPAGGAWHIGVASGKGSHVETIDVAEGTVASVTLQLPETSVITVIADPPLPPELLAYGTVVASAGGRDKKARRTPRPGERSYSASRAPLVDGRRAEIRVLPGVEYQVSLNLPSAHHRAMSEIGKGEVRPVFDPTPRFRLARAGDTVRFKVVPLGVLQATCVVGDADSAKSVHALLRATRGNTKRWVGYYNPSKGLKGPVRTVLPAGDWRLTMRGQYRIEPVSVRIRGGQITEIEVHALRNATPTPVNDTPLHPARSEDPPDLPPVTIEVVAPPGLQGKHQALAVAIGRNARGERYTADNAGDVSSARTLKSEFDDLDAETVFAAVLPWHALRTSRSAKAYRVTPVPAGYLIVVPQRPIPLTVGEMMLSARDGGILPVAEFNDKGRVSMEEIKVQPVVRLGTLLGPLPAGRYAFDVWLGGRKIRRVVAEVKANVIESLLIPAVD